MRHVGPLATRICIGCAFAVATACGSNGPTASPTNSGVPPARATPAPGYVRFTTKAVTVPANASTQWIEWVQSPFDHDVDVVDIQGTQSAGGHHAVLYSSTEIEAVGTQREWKDSDIVSAHFLGGIGGEGGSQLKLPEGAVFRLRAHQALALQTHYLNAGAEPLQGTTQLDVKFGPPASSDRVASLLTNTAYHFSIPAEGKLHAEVSCKLTQDASVLMFTNHMHQWGTSASTQLAVGESAPMMLKDDPVWNAEWTTNPNFTKMTIDAPLLLKAGDTLTTSCDWANTTNQALAFPSEMCVFISFYLGDSDVGCVDNGAFGAD